MPPFASNVAVYWLIVHCATYVVFAAGIVEGTDGDQPEKAYPSRVTVGAVKGVP